jgi:hypothetical protein
MTNTQSTRINQNTVLFFMDQTTSSAPFSLHDLSIKLKTVISKKKKQWTGKIVGFRTNSICQHVGVVIYNLFTKHCIEVPIQLLDSSNNNILQLQDTNILVSTANADVHIINMQGQCLQSFVHHPDTESQCNYALELQNEDIAIDYTDRIVIWNRKGEILKTIFHIENKHSDGENILIQISSGQIVYAGKEILVIHDRTYDVIKKMETKGTIFHVIEKSSNIIICTRDDEVSIPKCDTWDINTAKRISSRYTDIEKEYVLFRRLYNDMWIAMQMGKPASAYYDIVVLDKNDQAIVTIPNAVESDANMSQIEPYVLACQTDNRVALYNLQTGSMLSEFTIEDTCETSISAKCFLF